MRETFVTIDIENLNDIFVLQTCLNNIQTH